ncbi:MAG: hypothetical protein H8E57_08200 [Candidatus Cloacimonetes bacterium]|nr:hypothetical protein [Candidatus Cloacimonadota bacterium]
MGNISSSCLFHFTNKFEYLKNILRDEFIPRYSLENLTIGKADIEIAIPMICFCDIPLSNIKHHIRKYGNYAIGMSLEWAEKNGINPVIYLKNNSILSKQLQKISTIIKPDSHTEITNPEAILALTDILRYIKSFNGSFKRNWNSYENTDEKFYDEREWRYIPSIEDTKIEKAFISPVEFNKKANKALLSIKLNFIPDDIKYIIVSNENEIPKILETIKYVKSHRRPKEIELLLSRILTVEQIKNDF